MDDVPRTGTLARERVARQAATGTIPADRWPALRSLLRTPGGVGRLQPALQNCSFAHARLRRRDLCRGLRLALAVLRLCCGPVARLARAPVARGRSSRSGASLVRRVAPGHRRAVRIHSARDQRSDRDRGDSEIRQHAGLVRQRPAHHPARAGAPECRLQAAHLRRRGRLSAHGDWERVGGERRLLRRRGLLLRVDRTRSREAILDHRQRPRIRHDHCPARCVGSVPQGRLVRRRGRKRRFAHQVFFEAPANPRAK